MVCNPPQGSGGGGGSSPSKYTLARAGQLSISASGVWYFALGNNANKNSSEDQVQYKIPHACTIDQFYVYVRGNSNANDIVFHVRKNGADTAVTLTVTALTANSWWSDLSNSVSFAAGDLFSLGLVSTDAGNFRPQGMSVQVTVT